MEASESSTVTIQVERKTTSKQIVIYPKYSAYSGDLNYCSMALITKGTGYADVTSYKLTVSPSYTNIIIIDVPFDI